PPDAEGRRRSVDPGGASDLGGPSGGEVARRVEAGRAVVPRTAGARGAGAGAGARAGRGGRAESRHGGIVDPGGAGRGAAARVAARGADLSAPAAPGGRQGGRARRDDDRLDRGGGKGGRGRRSSAL